MQPFAIGDQHFAGSVPDMLLGLKAGGKGERSYSCAIPPPHTLGVYCVFFVFVCSFICGQDGP